MNQRYVKGSLSENDFYEIYLIDKSFYGEKYLLKLEDYKNRYIKNPNIYYTSRDSRNRIIGYFSVIPVTYDAYVRIKNGELDKEVLTLDNILSPQEEAHYVYLDSLVINPSYRSNSFKWRRFGSRLYYYVYEDVLLSNPNLKRAITLAISKGGKRLSEKNGFQPKFQISKEEIIFEKNIIEKKKVKKKLYKDKNKNLIISKRRNIDILKIGPDY